MIKFDQCNFIRFNFSFFWKCIYGKIGILKSEMLASSWDGTSGLNPEILELLNDYRCITYQRKIHSIALAKNPWNRRICIDCISHSSTTSLWISATGQLKDLLFFCIVERTHFDSARISRPRTTKSSGWLFLFFRYSNGDRLSSCRTGLRFDVTNDDGWSFLSAFYRVWLDFTGPSQTLQSFIGCGSLCHAAINGDWWRFFHNFYILLSVLLGFTELCRYCFSTTMATTEMTTTIDQVQ